MTTMAPDDPYLAEQEQAHATIALATGFSANTVSLALRESRRIPKDTRDLILAAARQLNYLPSIDSNDFETKKGNCKQTMFLPMP